MSFHLEPLVDAGRLVFVSGQLGLDTAGNVRGATIAEQTHLALANMERLLAKAGLGLADVVKTTVWITRAEDFRLFDAAYAEAFGHHKPARSTVVAQLVLPPALVEIEAIAMRKGA
jgi:2-iminobutanoate/2-iminopropanoate deaminase